MQGQSRLDAAQADQKTEEEAQDGADPVWSVRRGHVGVDRWAVVVYRPRPPRRDQSRWRW